MSKPNADLDTLILKALEKARLGIADKTPDTPVAYAGFDVWEQVHTVALVQAINTLIVAKQVEAKYQVLQELLEWEDNWSATRPSGDRFNWYGAVKAMLVMKDPQKPFVELNKTKEKV